MQEKNKLPLSVGKLPKQEQAKVLLKAALASKLYKQAGKKVPVPRKEE